MVNQIDTFWGRPPRGTIKKPIQTRYLQTLPYSHQVVLLIAKKKAVMAILVSDLWPEAVAFVEARAHPSHRGLRLRTSLGGPARMHPSGAMPNNVGSDGKLSRFFDVCCLQFLEVFFNLEKKVAQLSSFVSFLNSFWKRKQLEPPWRPSWERMSCARPKKRQLKVNHLSFCGGGRFEGFLFLTI